MGEPDSISGPFCPFRRLSVLDRKKHGANVNGIGKQLKMQTDRISSGTQGRVRTQ